LRIDFSIILVLFLLISSCQTSTTKAQEVEIPNQEPIIQQEEKTIDSTDYNYSWQSSYNYKEALINNIPVPKGYKRIDTEINSFKNWLNHLPINLLDNNVYTFSGEKKYNQNAQYKVVNIDIGDRDLQQCADAVMRLRAEYLFSSKKYDKIHFNYTNGVNIPFSKWSSGYYPSLKGNKVVWVSSSNNKSYKSFRKYLTNIFTYAGTSSLEKEMITVQLSEIKAGDVFIKGGFPGHAVIVVDVVINEKTKDKAFLIAQSYMPAQSIHILKNPINTEMSPWYSVNEINNVIETPEWTFNSSQLKRFKE
jgi:Domain of unknown function (4846)